MGYVAPKYLSNLFYLISSKPQFSKKRIDRVDVVSEGGNKRHRQNFRLKTPVHYDRLDLEQICASKILETD